MDELTSLRELYGEPEADPLLEARVRSRVQAGVRGRAPAGARGRPAAWFRRDPGSGLRGRPRAGLLRRTEPDLRRLRWPWAPIVAGLAAAAAVAAAVVVPGTTAGEPGGSGRIAALSGRSILLAAASTAASEPAPTGAYWRVRKLHRQTHPEPLGRGGNRYRLVESRVTEQWAARDGRVWSGSRALGARPASKADEDAWRRDGSPAEWSSGGRTLSTAAEEGRLTATAGGTAFSMAGRAMTFEQVQGLPTETAALKEWVSRTVREEQAAGTPAAGPPGSFDGVVADALSGLLWSKPSPPAVRAAAYRALAELPDVRYLGEATDERGRRGAAFSFALRTAPVVRRTLVIDPADSQVLSSTVTGPPGSGGDRVELVLEAGWTDDEPVAPELP
ncbi:CU044_5270 family protein [Planomonospora sp. ID82291]|uniref:CU044_5270 family protein n=1 Tax=Planomonospora sp. ID82291 TaxID=2738136 RepID=UPI0018C376A4|nr:CU044_5270 family protein [Planomonospora sp. ID82291]MBG0814570.1 CU044_5270 family protein [Planomonospora sp. ID82291]